MTSPAVSVVTPTKNRVRLLRETIDSVRAQTFPDWEHLIVDDGSDDGTAEMVEALAAADPRIRYIRRVGEKAGANVCRNIGIREARADLLVFLDSDDLLQAGCLQGRVQTMRRNSDLDFAVYRAGLVVRRIGDAAGLWHRQDPADDLLRFSMLECPWDTTGPIWRRAFLARIGGFDEALLSMQDLEMHVRAIAAGGKYLYIPAVDHNIRFESGDAKTSVRHFKDPAYIRATEYAHERLLDALVRYDRLTWSRRRALVGLGFGTAECWVALGRMKEAFGAWRRACRRNAAPGHLHFVGILMLCLYRAGASESSFARRVVNKWKGWVRFRQEPALLDVAAAGGGRT